MGSYVVSPGRPGLILVTDYALLSLNRIIPVLEYAEDLQGRGVILLQVLPLEIYSYHFQIHYTPSGQYL